MLTILGIICLSIAGIKYFIEYNESIKIKIPGKTKPLALAGIILIFSSGIFFINPAGTAVAVQYPWGGDKLVRTQGIKTKWWGRIISLSYEISIQDRINPEKRFGDGIYNRSTKLWEFSDAIKARIETAVVIGMEINDEEVFLKMADNNRSEAKLIYGRVMPNIDAALKNTAKLMDAQEYISGRASDFDRFFRDQLENGAYIVEAYLENDNQEAEIIGDTATIRTVARPNDSNSNQTKYRIVRDDLGEPIRDSKSSTLKQYGITIHQAQVTSIDWEDSFDERLDQQKQEVARTQLEKQEAERQFFTTQKEIAKGEAEKAAERARLEKEQIKLTIAAETEAKVQEQNLLAEKKRYEVEQYKAKSKKVAADAIYYENLKRVQAGLTPQERAELELKKATAIAREFAKMQVPQTVIIGNGEGGNTTEALLNVKLARDLMSEKPKQ